MAAQQQIFGQQLGLQFAAGLAGFTSFSINAGGTWLAFSFVAPLAKNLSKVKLFALTVTGSLAANDIQVDIFSDTGGGKPNVSLQSITGTFANAAWTEFTFAYPLALTAGKMYWIVIRNNNAAPATNFPAVGYNGASAGPRFGTGSGNWGWIKYQTANSGGTWGTPVAQVFGYRIGYDDGTYAGMPAQSGAGSGATNIFGANQEGVKFTTPPGGVLNVAGIAADLGSTAGSPTGNIILNLWSGSGATRTLIGTSVPIVNNTTIGTSAVFAMFATDVVLQPSTSYTMTVQDSAADSAGASYTLREMTMDNTAQSLALLPFEGTYQKTVCTNGPIGAGTVNVTTATFADTANVIPSMALLLDSNAEFLASGGGFVIGS